jgi:hypothetical protein
MGLVYWMACVSVEICQGVVPQRVRHVHSVKHTRSVDYVFVLLRFHRRLILILLQNLILLSLIILWVPIHTERGVFDMVLQLILSCSNLPLRLKLQRPWHCFSFLFISILFLYKWQVIRSGETLRLISCHHIIPSLLKFLKLIFEPWNVLIEWRPHLGFWSITLLYLNLMSLSVIVERLLELSSDEFVLFVLDHVVELSFFHILKVAVNGWLIIFSFKFRISGSGLLFFTTLIVLRKQRILIKVVRIYTRLVLVEDGNLRLTVWFVLKSSIHRVSRSTSPFSFSISLNSFGSMIKWSTKDGHSRVIPRFFLRVERCACFHHNISIVLVERVWSLLDWILGRGL